MGLEDLTDYIMNMGSEAEVSRVISVLSKVDNFQDICPINEAYSCFNLCKKDCFGPDKCGIFKNGLVHNPYLNRIYLGLTEMYEEKH